MIGVRSGEYRIRREEAQSGNHTTKGIESTNSTQRSHTAALEENSTEAASEVGQNWTFCSSHVPLKEQQVIRLKSEINHPGGVRVVLRKKDCVGSIAFVDYLGAVWYVIFIYYIIINFMN